MKTFTGLFLIRVFDIGTLSFLFSRPTNAKGRLLVFAAVGQEDVERLFLPGLVLHECKNIPPIRPRGKGLPIPMRRQISAQQTWGGYGALEEETSAIAAG
jgi:hypothetical protein